MLDQHTPHCRAPSRACAALPHFRANRSSRQLSYRCNDGRHRSEWWRFAGPDAEHERDTGGRRLQEEPAWVADPRASEVGQLASRRALTVPVPLPQVIATDSATAFGTLTTTAGLPARTLSPALLQKRHGRKNLLRVGTTPGT